jgi:hypothetical protein
VIFDALIGVKQRTVCARALRTSNVVSAKKVAMRTVPSLAPETIRPVSAAMAIPAMAASCILMAAMSAPVAASQTRRRPSLQPERTRASLLLKTMLVAVAPLTCRRWISLSLDGLHRCALPSRPPLAASCPLWLSATDSTEPELPRNAANCSLPSIFHRRALVPEPVRTRVPSVPNTTLVTRVAWGPNPAI